MGASALLGVAATRAVSTPALIVADHDTELLTIPITEGTQVILEYTHSVERTLVSDVYLASNGGFVSDRMEFSSFGAGLPSHAEVTQQGDRYVYHPPPARYDTLSVSIGHTAGHELIVANERYDLVEKASHRTVSLRIEDRVRV